MTLPANPIHSAELGAKRGAGPGLVVIFLLGLAAAAQGQSTVVTFDDLQTDYYYQNDGTHLTNTVQAPLPENYNGLDWNNIYAVDGQRWPEALGQSAAGFASAIISPKNEAIVAPAITNSPSGAPMLDPSHTSADISSGREFDLVSGYFTSLYFSDLALEVQGFNGTNLLYDQTFTLQYGSPQFIELNFDEVTDVHLVSSGGELGDTVDGVGSRTYAIDNLTVDAVPEPTMLALASFGGLGLFGLARKRT